MSFVLYPSALATCETGLFLAALNQRSMSGYFNSPHKTKFQKKRAMNSKILTGEIVLKPP